MLNRSACSLSVLVSLAATLVSFGGSSAYEYDGADYNRTDSGGWRPWTTYNASGYDRDPDFSYEATKHNSTYLYFGAPSLGSHGGWFPWLAPPRYDPDLEQNSPDFVERADENRMTEHERKNYTESNESSHGGWFPWLAPPRYDPDLEQNSTDFVERADENWMTEHERKNYTASNETADSYGPPLPFDPNDAEYRRVVDEDIQEPKFRFTPTDQEAQAKRMEIRYNAIDDSYDRPLAGSSLRISSWKTALWRYYNIERKREYDHEYVYLARMNTVEDNHCNAFLEYRIDLRPTALIVKNLQVRLPYRTYRDGTVTTWISSASNYTNLVIPQEGDEHLQPVPSAQGWDDFVIRVVFAGVQRDGRTKNAYQDAQLFREKYERPDDGVWNDPLRIVVELA